MRRAEVSNRALRRRCEKLRRTTGAPASGAALAALTSGVMAMPGLSGQAAADSPVEDTTLNYNYSYYREDSIPIALVPPGGETERYQIHMNQFHVKTPAPKFEAWDLDLDLVYESMSGATPYYVQPDPGTGDPLQVMTGATVEEQRVDVALTLNRYLDDGLFRITGGTSVENDYLAGYFGFSADKHFNSKNTTISGGFTASFDTIEPTDSDIFPDRVKKANKQTYSLYAGLSQILSRRSIAQLNLTYLHGDGFLTDPYKRVWFDALNTSQQESRPDNRDQLTLLLRTRHHFGSIGGSLHADYRFYTGSWDIRSHTFELSWHQTFGMVRLVPSFRYYSQSEAQFYAPYFIVVPTSGFYTSDYRMSPYGAFEAGLRLEVAPPPIGHVYLRGMLEYQRYLSGADFALQSVAVANPGLVDFHLFTVGIRGSF